MDERTNERADNNTDEKSNETTNKNSAETVSGFLYDMLQKEVISLRKSCHEKDQILKDKDDAIEMLAKKVDTLTKAMEVEARKVRREVAAMEKEVAAMRASKEQETRAKLLGTKGSGSSQLLPERSTNWVDAQLPVMAALTRSSILG
ncbi:Microtubule-associated protein 70-1 [Zea mays]|uniref:Microtubule-associated protein 70-1 n=1 Tax=Zea mays TaxID=4577 RepID=A0A1D6NQZ3_MAIZE|nr:Microtubule-associated protein 70-1 [Zea mays]